MYNFLLFLILTLTGIDLEPGREGGTWQGMSKTGKFAVLLNILSIRTHNMKGRGNDIDRSILGILTYFLFCMHFYFHVHWCFLCKQLILRIKIFLFSRNSLSRENIN